MSNLTTQIAQRIRATNAAVSPPELAKALRTATGAINRNAAQLPDVIKPVPVRVRVVRDAQGITTDLVTEPKELTLSPSTQFVWYCSEGKLEIRLGRKTSPLVGDSYETPLGGFSFSGPPLPKRLKQEFYRFTALVTTPDGDFVAREFVFKVID